MASSANCMNDYSKTSPANSSPSPSNKFTAQSQKDTSAPDSSRLGQRSDTDQQISSLENSPKTILITSPKPAKDYRPCTNHSSSSYKYEIKEEEAGSNTRKEDNPGLKDDVDAILARIMSSADLNRGARPKSIIPVAEEEPKWRDIGEYEVLRRTKCRRLYSRRGQSKDLALFYRSGKFYAMEAWCSHMGKFKLSTFCHVLAAFVCCGLLVLCLLTLSVL